MDQPEVAGLEVGPAAVRQTWPAARRDLRALTGLRGIAALSVACTHLGYGRFGFFHPLLFPDAAVDVFFCLSGFTLCYAYRAGAVAQLPSLAYLRARFARIYPLYAATLFLTWLLIFRHLGGSGLYPPRLYHGDAVRQVLMVNNWPLIGAGRNWDLPAWSISIEALCYLAVFPPLFALTGRAARLPRAVLLAAMVGCCYLPVLGFMKYWSGVEQLGGLDHPAVAPIAYWMPALRGVPLFAAGWIAYVLWSRDEETQAIAGRLCDTLALGFLGVVLAGCLGLLFNNYSSLLAPGLIAGLATNERAVTARLLACRPVHWLGEISYSIYLLHAPLNYELHHLWPALAGWPALDVGVTCLLLIAAAGLSYHGFERPMRDLVRGGRPGVRHVAVSRGT